MIHSMAGGNLKDYGVFDIAKVELLEGDIGKVIYVVSTFKDLKEGDIVLIPDNFNIEGVKAKVLRVDKKVHEQNFPIPIKRLKTILKIYENR